MSIAYTPETLRILTEARALIARPGGWCQHASALNARGEECDPRGANGEQFCFVGAIEHAAEDANYYGVIHAAEVAVRETESGWSVTAYNDAFCRTQEEVVAVYDRALALVREKLEATP